MLTVQYVRPSWRCRQPARETRVPDDQNSACVDRILDFVSGQITGHALPICQSLPSLSPQQDIFDMGLLPADTDFRMFSYGHHGQWPGIDIAFLLDAAAYHTDRDITTRIRPGTLQVGNLEVAGVSAWNLRRQERACRGR